VSAHARSTGLRLEPMAGEAATRDRAAAVGVLLDCVLQANGDQPVDATQQPQLAGNRAARLWNLAEALGAVARVRYTLPEAQLQAAYNASIDSLADFTQWKAAGVGPVQHAHGAVNVSLLLWALSKVLLAGKRGRAPSGGLGEARGDAPEGEFARAALAALPVAAAQLWSARRAAPLALCTLSAGKLGLSWLDGDDTDVIQHALAESLPEMKAMDVAHSTLGLGLAATASNGVRFSDLDNNLQESLLAAVARSAGYKDLDVRDALGCLEGLSRLEFDAKRANPTQRTALDALYARVLAAGLEDSQLRGLFGRPHARETENETRLRLQREEDDKLGPFRL
jgi:hypothetical protein